MAVNWNPDAGVARTAHGYSVLPKNVVILADLTGRAEATDVSELAADIVANGQLELAVCWKNDQGWPVLAAGHRRYRALQLANEGKAEEDQIRLQFSYVGARNEQEAFDYTVRENRNRINPSPLDDAHNMHTYQVKFGLSEEQIASKYFPGLTTPEEKTKALAKVKECLKLLDLSDDAKEALRAGTLSTSAALQIAAIPSRKTQDEVIAEAKAKGQKKIKVSAAKAAKEKATGKKSRVTSISDNTPIKLLPRYKKLAEVASALAAEYMAPDFGKMADADTAREFAEQIAVMCYKLGIPQVAALDKWAAAHDHIPTAMDDVAA